MLLKYSKRTTLQLITSRLPEFWGGWNLADWWNPIPSMSRFGHTCYNTLSLHTSKATHLCSALHSMQPRISRDACQLSAFFEKTTALATVGRKAKTQVLKNAKQAPIFTRKRPAWADMSNRVSLYVFLWQSMFWKLIKVSPPVNFLELGVHVFRTNIGDIRLKPFASFFDKLGSPQWRYIYYRKCPDNAKKILQLWNIQRKPVMSS